MSDEMSVKGYPTRWIAGQTLKLDKKRKSCLDKKVRKSVGENDVSCMVPCQFHNWVL
jgi:hypothetical protein